MLGANPDSLASSHLFLDEFPEFWRDAVLGLRQPQGWTLTGSKGGSNLEPA